MITFDRTPKVDLALVQWPSRDAQLDHVDVAYLVARKGSDSDPMQLGILGVMIRQGLVIAGPKPEPPLGALQKARLSEAGLERRRELLSTRAASTSPNDPPAADDRRRAARPASAGRHLHAPETAHV